MYWYESIAVPLNPHITDDAEAHATNSSNLGLFRAPTVAYIYAYTPTHLTDIINYNE